MYEKLKGYLINRGISEKEIAFIHSYHSESRKLELYCKVNEGKIRVLIGSTFKLGIGANVQTKLKAVHHLDVPWRPADMVQREVRILRRGNENSRVYIYRYIAEGSFDAYLWQILETKQKFITQFLKESSYQRTASDLESNILTYAEVKALALSISLMKQVAEKENELRNLKILRKKHNDALEALKVELENLPKKMPDMNAAVQNLNYLEGLGKNDYIEATQNYRGLIIAEVISGDTQLSENYAVLGFEIHLPENQNPEKPYIFLERGSGRYYVEMGDSSYGNIRRIINFLKGFRKTYNKLAEENEKLKLRKMQIEAELAKPDPYSKQIEECQRQVDELKSMIPRDEEEEDM